ncbi:DUF2752 domain-containing protein [Mycobacterium kyorinense]|uniref:DUF2752 domain-containing protein n=1 Tax=Mycobacterium kyorinense TaxID=487514 RepID=UPI001E3D7F8A|nr:DUF2752 domain-containing protein [Mycobacterium kyorinense]
MQQGRRTPTLHRLGAPLGVAAAAVLACAAVWWADPTTPGGPLPVCPTKLLLGIDCPGCGTLRMVYALLHGDLLAAARFNALALAATVLLGRAYAAWTYGRVTGRRVWSWQRYRWAASATLVLVSVWFVVRNLPFGPFPALRV